MHLGVHAGLPTVVAVVEDAAAQWLADAARVLRRKTGGGRVVLLDAPRGTIERTSSGKPKRRVLWARFTTTGLPGDVHADSSEEA